MRRIGLVILVFLIQGAAGAAPRSVPPLGAGESRFWVGPEIESSAASDVFEYSVAVRPGGYRLRVGIDHPEVGDVFQVEVDGPGDSASFSVGPGIYSAERLFQDPKPGVWTFRVVPQDVTESAFRLRVKLEARPPSLGTKKGPILPNLQILPPHEASFLLPATNGSTDDDPTGVGVAGLVSCHPEEYIQDGATRCLRFAYGVRNTGLGPMDLFYTGSSPTERDLFQRIHRADGTIVERPAGKAVFHESHGHFHHAEAVGLQLFRVEDTDDGVLVEASDKRSKGFAHRNELMRDWDVFYPTLDLMGFGLKPGWADIYEWDRPGNYIDFGLNGDGAYVLRMWADPVGGILESNERDNLGYTYFEVAGNNVELIEAGRGRDPWDPCKIVVGFGGHPDPPRGPRPARCPPDTT